MSIETVNLETIIWKPAIKPPDKHKGVLLAFAQYGISLPGYWDGVGWHFTDHVPVKSKVTHWARYPKGPPL